MLSQKYQTPVKLETIKSGVNSVSVFRTQKIGTKIIFFFVANDENKRIGSTLWARKCEAISLGKSYLKSTSK